MKLKNFELASSVELRTGELIWDIHNFANFEGLELIPAQDAVVMKWIVLNRDKPWGCVANKFSGMNLYFDDLQFLKINARDPDMPFTEDGCVSAILKVDPNIRHNDPYMRTRNVWTCDDLFRLVFLFQSARVIEVESETVELIPIP
jgi:hypothetical protein